MPTATLFTLLDTDWALLEPSSAAQEAFQRWRREEQGLAGLTTLPDLVTTAERRDSPERSDAILAALARRAPTDDLAARTLLQLLLPGARAIARRLWWLGTPDERATAVVGAVYERIRTYPWQRRPARIAANVLADAAQRLQRGARPARPAEVPLEELDERAFPSDPADEAAGPTEELVELLVWAARAGHLTRSQVCLIAQTRIADVDFEELSRREGLSAHSLRRRRQRAERALAAAVAGRAAKFGEDAGRVLAPACA